MKQKDILFLREQCQLLFLFFVENGVKPQVAAEKSTAMFGRAAQAELSTLISKALGKPPCPDSSSADSAPPSKDSAPQQDT
jgi:hypothetical protein